MRASITFVSFAATLLLAASVHAQAPAGATGLCKDGSYYTGPTKRGACRGHKGVKDWYAAESKAAAAPAVTAEPAADKAKSRKHKATETTAPAAIAAPAASAPMPAGATGLCKDGTYYSGATKKGACRGHKGVKDWYASESAPAAAPAPAMPPTRAVPAAAAPVSHAPTVAAPAVAAATAAATQRYTPPAVAAAGGGAGQVWVNRSTKVYHCPGDRWYGKTKQGEYMSESAAKAAGIRADHGHECQQ